MNVSISLAITLLLICGCGIRPEIHSHHNLAGTKTRSSGTTTQSVFYVEGRVMDPGKFLLVPPIKIMDALERAGGVEDFSAHPWKVTLTRGEAIMMFDRRKLRNNPELDIEIEPSDRIYIDTGF